jgi:polar amino acid transport system substrate-binding protein
MGPGRCVQLQRGRHSTGIPFTFLDVKSNTIQGMMVDTVTAVGKAGGFAVNIQQTGFAALIPSLTSNKIDIISAAMLKTAARQQVVDFSDPVYSYGEGLLVKADDARAYASLDDLKGEVVGAQVGTVFLDMLNKKGIFKEVRSYDSVADMARDLALGRIKAGLGDQPIMAYQMRQNGLPGCAGRQLQAGQHGRCVPGGAQGRQRDPEPPEQGDRRHQGRRHPGQDHPEVGHLRTGFCPPRAESPP